MEFTDNFLYELIEQVYRFDDLPVCLSEFAKVI